MTGDIVEAQFLTLAHDSLTLRSELGESYRITLILVPMEWMTKMKCSHWA